MIESTGAGGVILNTRGEIALVKNGFDDPPFWGLPKGTVDEGEEVLEAALREIEEETGLTDLRMVKKLGVYQRYRGTADGGDDTSELKTIHMFLFESPDAVLAPQDPWNPEARWMAPDEAITMLTHPKDREFLVGVVASLGI